MKFQFHNSWQVDNGDWIIGIYHSVWSKTSDLTFEFIGFRFTIIYKNRQDGKK